MTKQNVKKVALYLLENGYLKDLSVKDLEDESNMIKFNNMIIFCHVTIEHEENLRL